MPIKPVPIIESLKEDFKSFAEELIINNLPMIDGLLMCHKKVLWGMYKKGTTPNKPFVKNIKNIGDVVNFYVYGNGPLYHAMVNMSNNGMNIPLLDWDGSNGDKFSEDGTPASDRYTSSRISNFGLHMLKGIEYNAVDMKPNYDNTCEEPIIAPSIPPQILLNNSESISISEASKIPPHNVYETCDSIIKYIKTKDILSAREILKCPDFSNGCNIIYNKEVFDKIYNTGQGSFTLVGNYTYDEKRRIISIYEVPFVTTIEAIQNKIELLYEKGKFKEVTNIRNGSGKDGLRLDIHLKMNTDIDKFIKNLRKYTPFESKYSCNFTILGLDYSTPYRMNLEGIYITYLQHRRNCIKNELNFKINKYKTELNKLLGLQIINTDLDKTLQIIRSSKNEKMAIKDLAEYFKLNDEQAEYVGTIKAVNLNQEWIINKIENIEFNKTKINELESILNSEEQINNIIIEQLEEVKKIFGKPRMTQIIYEDNLPQIKEEEFIEDYSTTLILTKEQYFKKTKKYSEKQTLKDGDEILQIIQSSNKNDLLLFTDKGKVFTRKLNDINDCTPSQHGEYIPNLLKNHINKDEEKIIYIISPESYDKGHMLFIYEDGTMTKTPLSSYKTSHKSITSKAQKAYNTEHNIKYIQYIEKDIDMLCLTSEGKALIFNTEQINPKSTKTSFGNPFIKLESKKFENNTLVDIIFNPTEETILKFKTTKKDLLEFKLSDIAEQSKDKIPYLEYLKGKKNSTGNFIYNCRQKNDRILELIK